MDLYISLYISWYTNQIPCLILATGVLGKAQRHPHPDSGSLHLHVGPEVHVSSQTRDKRVDFADQMGPEERRWDVRVPSQLNPSHVDVRSSCCCWWEFSVKYHFRWEPIWQALLVLQKMHHETLYTTYDICKYFCSALRSDTRYCGRPHRVWKYNKSNLLHKLRHRISCLHILVPSWQSKQFMTTGNLSAKSIGTFFNWKNWIYSIIISRITDSLIAFFDLFPIQSGKVAVVNYDSDRGGISVITVKAEVSTSHLVIRGAREADAGKYYCSPSNADVAFVHVHVHSSELWVITYDTLRVHELDFRGA